MQKSQIKSLKRCSEKRDDGTTKVMATIYNTKVRIVFVVFSVFLLKDAIALVGDGLSLRIVDGRAGWAVDWGNEESRRTHVAILARSLDDGIGRLEGRQVMSKVKSEGGKSAAGKRHTREVDADTVDAANSAEASNA
jgi:hypothetical protein